MTAINLSDDGEHYLERIMDTFEVEPSKRKTVEKALEVYKEKRLSEDN